MEAKSTIDRHELLETAREYFRNSEYKIVEPMLGQLLTADPLNPEVFYMMGTIFYYQCKFNKAIKTFRRALEIDPSYTDASVGLSVILNDLGKYDEAKKVFQDAEEVLRTKSAESDPYLQEKLALKHDEMGELYFQFKRYDDAIDEYLKALTLTTKKIETKMKIVECFVQKGETDRAIKELKQIASEQPQFINARLRLGLLLYNQKKTVEAIEQWESVLLRDPDNPMAQNYLQMAQSSQTTRLEL